jgi:SepF-like predicted cell division protein (DUF552 family)
LGVKRAEYQAKMFSVETENGVKKIIVHATDGTFVIIKLLGENQNEMAERTIEAPCA